MDNLYLDIQEAMNRMEISLSELKKYGVEFVQKEHDYRSELSKLLLLKREAGIPATILGDVCRGDRRIAKIRLDRDCAEVLYKVAQESINVYKLEFKHLEAQIDREYRG